jgi:hypothetical protein
MNRMRLTRSIQKSFCPSSTIREAFTGEGALEKCGEETLLLLLFVYVEYAGGIIVATDLIRAMR